MDDFIRLVLTGELSLGPCPEERIVPYTPGEHHDLIPVLYAESFNDQPWKDDWDAIDAFDPAGVFLAQPVGGRMFVGFVISFQKNDFGYISVVAIVPDFRRRGFADALVRAAVAFLRGKRLRKIVIDVEKDNIAARALYEKLGFRIMKNPHSLNDGDDRKQ